MEKNPLSAETPSLLSTTTAYCTECRTIHAAFYQQEGGNVIYSIACPRTPKRTVVSTDADLFAALRAHETPASESGPSGRPRHRFFLIELTDCCNFECPICYAASGPGGRRCRSVQEVRDLGLQIKAAGGRRASLSGGEPTLHPQLPEIVRVLRHELKLSPVLVTNGLKLGEDPAYARVLKAAGLRSVYLQFDTLDPTTYERMRGRKDVGEKIRAVENVRAAGLSLGLVVTVCPWNLDELRRLVKYACSLVPALKIVVFQPAVPIGRSPDDLVNLTREDVIHGLVESGEVHGLRPADFFPFLPTRAGQCVPHPDCSAHAVLCVKGEHVSPLSANRREVVFTKERGPAGRVRRGLLYSELIPRQVLDGMRSANRDGRQHVLLLSIMAFMRPDTRNEQRLARCIVAMVNHDNITGLCECGCGRAPLNTRPASPTLA